MSLPVMPSTHTWVTLGPGLGGAGRVAMYVADGAEVWVWDEDTDTRITDLLDADANPVTTVPVSGGWLGSGNPPGIGVPVGTLYVSFSVGQFGKRMGTLPVQALIAAGAALAPTDSQVATLLGNPASSTRVAGDGVYAAKPDNGAKAVGKGELFVVDTDYASLEDALTATATGGTLEVRTAWSRSTTISVSKSCTIRFARSGSVTVTTPTVNAITVAANDVTIDAPNLIGTGSNASNTSSGIYAAGADKDTPITGLQIDKPKITGFNQNGISMLFCSDFRIRGLRLSSIAYGGIMFSSCWDGEVAGGSIKTITMPSPLTNAYGLAVSYNESLGIATNPQSHDINVHDVTVDGVPTWEGLDTHAGIRVAFHHNTVRNCKVGIAVVPGRNVGASPVLSPKGIDVSNNLIDSGLSTGALTQGISFVGCSTGLGFHNNTDWATGSITNNRIYRCGNDAVTSGAAVSLQDTLGLVISGNTFYEPVVSAIRLDYNNKDAVVIGNTATDVWTNTAAYAAMIQTNQWNTVKMGGNALTRGTKSATTVNSVGLRVNSALATVIVEQGNDFLGATSPYSLATPLIRVDQHGIRHSYVTASPTMGVWQQGAQALNTAPAAAGSPGWVCTTAGGASSATWAATTAYSAAAWVKTSTGKVLECVVAGTSSGSEPSPSTIDGVVTDGTVTWVYRSAASAVFKALPNLAA